MNPLFNTNTRSPRVAQSVYQEPGQADTYFARHWQQAGQISPHARNTLMRQHGRYLSGFGDVGGPSGPGGDPDTADAALDRMEDDDDTAGSGVFDPPGSTPTANANLGVFASYNSLPGYVAREVPFAVSRDEFDATSSAPIVTVPNGGLPLVATSLARPGAGSSRDETYVSFPTRRLPPPSAAEVVGPDYRRVPRSPGNAWVRPLSALYGSLVPPTVRRQPVPARSMVGVATGPLLPVARPRAVAGLGADGGGTPVWQYALAGAIVSAAAYWAYKSVKGEVATAQRRASGAGW